MFYLVALISWTLVNPGGCASLGKLSTTIFNGFNWFWDFPLVTNSQLVASSPQVGCKSLGDTYGIQNGRLSMSDLKLLKKFVSRRRFDQVTKRDLQVIYEWLTTYTLVICGWLTVTPWGMWVRNTCKWLAIDNQLRCETMGLCIYLIMQGFGNNIVPLHRPHSSFEIKT